MKQYTQEDVKGDCLYCKHLKQRGLYGGPCVNDESTCSKPDKKNWIWSGDLPNYDYVNFSKS